MRSRIIMPLVTACIGFSVAWFSKPAVIETREIVRYRVLKDVKKDINTVVKRTITKEPNGREVTEVTETTVDKSKETTNVKRDTETLTLQSRQPDYSVAIYRDLSEETYFISADRRIVGGLYAGFYLQGDVTDIKGYGVGLRLTF